MTDSMELEEYLTDRLGAPAPGGHRFGDELGALRVRLGTGPLLGATPQQQTESLAAAKPLEARTCGAGAGRFRGGVRRTALSAAGKQPEMPGAVRTRRVMPPPDGGKTFNPSRRPSRGRTATAACATPPEPR